MLEILLLFFLCKKIGAVVAAKGHPKVGYQVLLVVCWIIGEVGGAIIGVAMLGGGEGNMGALILPALLGAAGGATIAFVIANSLSDLRPIRDDYDDRDYPRDVDDRFRDRDRGRDRDRDEYTDRPRRDRDRDHDDYVDRPRERDDDRYR